jgi:hypothetical protein
LGLWEYVWVLFPVVVLTFAIFAFSVYRVLAQLRRIWESIEIEIGGEYVARRQARIDEKRLSREEVVAVQETERGLIIRARDRSRSMFVPAQLEEQGYEEVKATVLDWAPEEETSSQGKARKFVLVTSFVLGYLVVLLSWSRWLTLFVGIGMIVFLTYLYWLRRHDERAVSLFRKLYPGVVVTIALVTFIKFTPVFQEYSQFVRSLFFLYE